MPTKLVGYRGRGEAREHVVAAADAAAAAVAHDDQVLDLQRDHRVLDRGRGAVRAAVGLVGRDEVGDVAVDEEVAGLVAEDLGDQHPAVAAGDDHRLGGLSLVGELGVAGDLLGLRRACQAR